VVTHYDDPAKRHYQVLQFKYTAPANKSCRVRPVPLGFTTTNSAPFGVRAAGLLVLVQPESSRGTSAPGRGPGQPLAEECPVDSPCATGSLGRDVLALCGNVIGWSKADAIQPGPAAFTGAMVTGSGSSDKEFTIDVGQGGIDTSGSFGFIADCRGGGGECGRAQQVGTALCSGLKVTDPRLRLITVTGYLVPPLIVPDVHARPFGALFLTRTQPRDIFAALKGDNYLYFWADRDAKVTGACADQTVDLDLRRGWNPVHRPPGSYKTEIVPSDARWYFLNRSAR
jgi:hypothetical protein